MVGAIHESPLRFVSRPYCYLHFALAHRAYKCEQTVNERNFQIFTQNLEKCEKMKIIFKNSDFFEAYIKYLKYLNTCFLMKNIRKMY